MSAAIRLNQAKKLIRELASALHEYAQRPRETDDTGLTQWGVPDDVVDLLQRARAFAPPTKAELRTAKTLAKVRQALGEGT